MAKLDITAMEETGVGNICSTKIQPAAIHHYETGGEHGPYVILINLTELEPYTSFIQVTAIFDPPPYPRLTRWLDSIRGSFIGRMLGCQVETPQGVLIGQRGRIGNLVNTKGAN